MCADMGHKKYRICLLMVAVAATVGGILYYCFCIKEDETMEKGTLVKQMQQTGEKLKEAGRSVKEDMAQAFSSRSTISSDSCWQFGKMFSRNRYPRNF